MEGLMRISRDNWAVVLRNILTLFNLLVSAELSRASTSFTLWSVLVPSPGPYSNSPHVQWWHFLPYQALLDILSKRSYSYLLSNSPSVAIPGSFLSPRHQDYRLHGSVGTAELRSALWCSLALSFNCHEKQLERGNVLNFQSCLQRKAVLKLCLSLPGPVLSKVFLFGGTTTTFSFCI